MKHLRCRSSVLPRPLFVPGAPAPLRENVSVAPPAPGELLEIGSVDAERRPGFERLFESRRGPQPPVPSIDPDRPGEGS
jgi:hypothetical protein